MKFKLKDLTSKLDTQLPTILKTDRSTDF